MYKPQDHTSLSPYLIVDNAQTTLDFIKVVFGVEPIFVKRAPNGELSHVEVRIDGSILMVGQMAGAKSAAHVHVYVPDVDASFALATEAGGTVVEPPKQKDDADKRGGVTGPCGTTWWLATKQG